MWNPFKKSEEKPQVAEDLPTNYTPGQKILLEDTAVSCKQVSFQEYDYG